jgi:hypothetical protein
MARMLRSFFTLCTMFFRIRSDLRMTCSSEIAARKPAMPYDSSRHTPDMFAAQPAVLHS